MKGTEPADLSETNRNVSPALECIVHQCLETNPEQRFHSASDIAFDLEHLSGTTSSTAIGKMLRFHRRSPNANFADAGVHLLIVAGFRPTRLRRSSHDLGE